MSLFGSHSQLRAFAEVYGSADAKKRFAEDFAARPSYLSLVAVTACPWAMRL
jgi:catalase (peroxidase I)